MYSKLHSGNLTKKILLLIAFIFNIHSALATTYYSTNSGGYWNSPSTWSTVAYGDSTNTGTYPRNGDIVLIGDGYNILLNISVTVSGITIGEGVSGVIEILDAGTFTLTVAGSLKVNNGGKLWYNGNKKRKQKLFVSGNIINDGMIDLYSDHDDVCNLTFNSSINDTVSGNGSFDLNDVILYKASSAYFLDVQTSSFESGIRNLILTYGTYIHNNSGSYVVNSLKPTTFQIDPAVILKVSQGSMALSPYNDEVRLQGSLIVNGGTVYIGSTPGKKGLRTEQVGAVVPYLEVSSGSLIVYGGITYLKPGGNNDPFSFKMTGGNILLNCGTSGTKVEPLLMTDLSGSVFNMSGGTITLQASSRGGNGTVDFSLCGKNGTVISTGGTVEFGNDQTAIGDDFTFEPFANVVQPNFKVTGDPSVSFTLSASQAGTADFKLLSLYIDVAKTFDIRSLTGGSGDSKSMSVTSTYDGVNALHNDGTFIERTGTVIMEGTTLQQISGANKFTFYNLTMNNPAGASLTKSIDVSNQLTMTNGKLITTSASILTCLSNCNSNLGSALSFVDGPMINVVASTSVTTKNFPLGKNTSYRPVVLTVQHSTAASVTYQASMLNSSARALNYSLPPTLLYVSGVRYFIINRDKIPNLSNATIKLYYGSDDDVTEYNNLRIARDNGFSAWTNIGGTGTANNTGSITSSSFTGFNSLFTLANSVGGTNPLPVELINFNALEENKKVAFRWSTASETNSDYYEIEKSTDLINYTLVSHIKAAGNSNIILNYESYDNYPSPKTNYYRLKEVDFNGEISYSDIRTVELSESKENIIKIFPNPANTTIHLNTSQENFDINTLHIYDMNGKIIEFNLIDFSNGVAQIQLNSHVSNTIYKVVLQTPHYVWQDTILVNTGN